MQGDRHSLPLSPPRSFPAFFLVHVPFFLVSSLSSLPFAVTIAPACAHSLNQFSRAHTRCACFRALPLNRVASHSHDQPTATACHTSISPVTTCLFGSPWCVFRPFGVFLFHLFILDHPCLYSFHYYAQYLPFIIHHPLPPLPHTSSFPLLCMVTLFPFHHIPLILLHHLHWWVDHCVIFLVCFPG